MADADRRRTCLHANTDDQVMCVHSRTASKTTFAVLRSTSPKRDALCKGQKSLARLVSQPPGRLDGPAGDAEYHTPPAGPWRDG
jgi:hypothetical protein